MTKETPLVLLDTNIWMDYFDVARSGHQDARDLVLQVQNKKLSLVYSPSSAKDVFYVMGSTLKRIARQAEKDLDEKDAIAIQEIAWGCIKNMSEIATALPLGEPQMWIALHHRTMHGDFEDDLILAAAETDAVDYFVTNDMALLGKSSCPAFTCKDMLTFLSR